MKKIVFILIVTTFCFCSKEDDETEPMQNLVFHSLVAEKDTISPGEETHITATATGSNLQYFWSATLGDILGSGSVVVYTSSPCNVGTNEITCKIKCGDGQSKSKIIKIVVLEE